MIINSPAIVDCGDQVRIQALVEHSGTRELLWYSFDSRYRSYLDSATMDGFLVGVLPLAMKLGEDIVVKGAVSEVLHYNLTSYYMRIVELLFPSLKQVKIAADSFDAEDASASAAGVATGFSAGIDSFCTIYDHLRASAHPSYRLTHFIFNNVGSHGEWDANAAQKLFNARYDAISGFAEETGIPLIKVDSNLSQVLKMKFAETHASRNASSVLLLQRLIGKYYYASGLRFEETCLGPAPDIAYADPAAVHLLSSGRTQCISSGGQYSRVEKTKRVAQVESASRWLNVCVLTDTDGNNCSTCWKCMRTLVTLDMLGATERFGAVFDLHKWQKVRGSYIVEKVLNPRVKDPLTVEIREYARATGYSFGARYERMARVLGVLPLPAYKLCRRAAFRAYRLASGSRWKGSVAETIHRVGWQ